MALFGGADDTLFVGCGGGVDLAPAALIAKNNPIPPAISMDGKAIVARDVDKMEPAEFITPPMALPAELAKSLSVSVLAAWLVVDCASVFVSEKTDWSILNVSDVLIELKVDEAKSNFVIMSMVASMCCVLDSTISALPPTVIFVRLIFNT